MPVNVEIVYILTSTCVYLCDLLFRATMLVESSADHASEIRHFHSLIPTQKSLGFREYGKDVDFLYISTLHN